MEHARKMAIIPQSLVASLMNQQLLGNQGTAYLGELDGQMKSIMDDRNTPSDIKAKRYGQVLHKFLEMRGNELKEASQVHFAEQNIPTPTTATVPNSREDVLRTVSAKYKNRAKVLFDHVQDNPDLNWNETGQLVYKGSTIPRSNLADLLNQFSRPGNRLEKGFPGWKEFAQALHQHNAPRTAVGNRILLDAALAGEESEDFQSPPTSPEPSTSLARAQSTDGNTPSRPARNRQAPARYTPYNSGDRWRLWKP